MLIVNFSFSISHITKFFQCKFFVKWMGKFKKEVGDGGSESFEECVCVFVHLKCFIFISDFASSVSYPDVLNPRDTQVPGDQGKNSDSTISPPVVQRPLC